MLRKTHSLSLYVYTNFARQITLNYIYPVSKALCEMNVEYLNVRLGVMLNVHLSCVVDIFPPEDPIIQCHSCVIINELKDLQTRHLCSLQNCPALCLVEKGRNGDHSIFDRLFCVLQRETQRNTQKDYVDILPRSDTSSNSNEQTDLQNPEQVHENN